MVKEAGTLLMYSGDRRSGSGALDAIYVGADGHAAMHEETRPGVAWNAINIA
jgi:hypothetical protein